MASCHVEEKREETKMKKIMSVATALLLMASLTGCSNGLKVEAVKSLTAEYGEKLDNSKLFNPKKSDEGVSVKEVKNFDSYKIGDQEVTVVFTNDKKTKDEKVKITVKDTVKPEFVDFKKEIVIEQNAENVDLAAYFIAKDKADVKITVDGKVDLKKVGKYDIKVTAEDVNENKSETKSCVAVVVSRDDVEDGKELTATVKGDVPLSKETSKKVESGDVKLKVDKPSEAVTNEVKAQANKEEQKNQTSSTDDKKETSSNNSTANKTDKPSSGSSSDNKNEGNNSSSSSNTKPAEKPSSGSSSSSNGGGSSSSSKPTEKPSHQHDWKAVYKTVHHDEEGHNEKYVIKEAWDEQVPKYETKYVYVCDSCGYAEDNDTPENEAHFFNHLDAHLLDGTATKGYHSALKKIQVGTETVHHEAQYGTKWVVDKKAYDEKVLDHYECSCGETKK